MLVLQVVPHVLGARLSWDVLASCLHLVSGLFPFHVTFICWSLHVACGLQHGRQTSYVVPEGFKDIGVEAAVPSEGLDCQSIASTTFCCLKQVGRSALHLGA